MTKFLKLLRKDLEANKTTMLFFCGLIIGFSLLGRAKFFGSTSPLVVVIVVLAVAVPLIFVPLWLLWQTINSLRTEWKEDSIYTLMVLPVPGWQVLLSKLVTILIEYSVLLFVTIGAVFFTFKPLVLDFIDPLPLPWLIRNGIIAYVFSLVGFTYTTILMQLAFVVSKIVGRLQGLVGLWVLILANWLIGRVTLLLSPLLRLIPTVPLHRILRLDQIGQVNVVIDWPISSQIVSALYMLGLFVLTHYLFENYLEVSE